MTGGHAYDQMMMKISFLKAITWNPRRWEDKRVEGWDVDDTVSGVLLVWVALSIQVILQHRFI